MIHSFILPINRLTLKAFYCSDIKKAFFLEKESFVECSPNCLECISIKKCKKCETFYYLNYENYESYSCLPCSTPYNCRTCAISSKKKEILFQDYQEMDNAKENYLTRSTQDQWKLICIDCILNYFIKEDCLCHKCSDEIPYCLSCYYGTNETIDISSISSFDLYQKDQPFQGKPSVSCALCEGNLFNLFELTVELIFVSKCLLCSEIIPSCNTCQYSKKSNNTIEYLSSFKFNKYLLLDSNFSIRCTECQINWGLNNEGKKCEICNEKCESCLILPDSSKCLRCEKDYVLSYEQGVCFKPLPNENPSLTKFGEVCSRIISEIPLQNRLNPNLPFLCQTCQNMDDYPKINEACSNCTIAGCSKCFEGVYNGSVFTKNFTSMIFNDPFSLNINEKDLGGSVKGCALCDAESIFDKKNQICCHKSLPFPYGKVPELNCKICSSCRFYDNKFYNCDNCFQCNDFIYEKNENLINFNYPSPQFAKKIFVYKFPEAVSNITTQKQIDLYGNRIYQCTACTIGSLDCEVDPKINQDLSHFVSDGVEYYELMSFFLTATKCRESFIYDNFYKRCRYCPNKWRKCFASKIIKINFVAPETNQNGFSVSSLKELMDYIKKLEFSELAYMANEFLVERIEIHVVFDSNPPFKCLNDFQIILEGKLKLIVPSLKEYLLYFECNDRENRTSIYFGCAISIIGFTDVIFNNIIFMPLASEFNDDYLSKHPDQTLIIPSLQITADKITLNNITVLFFYQSNYLSDTVYKEKNPYKSNKLDDLVAFYFKSTFEIRITQFKVINIQRNANLYSYFKDVNLFNFDSLNLILDDFFFQSSKINDIESIIKLGKTMQNITIKNFKFDACNFSSTTLINFPISFNVSLSSFQFQSLQLLSSLIIYVENYDENFDFILENFTFTKCNFTTESNLNYYIFNIKYFSSIRLINFSDNVFFQYGIFYASSSVKVFKTAVKCEIKLIKINSNVMSYSSGEFGILLTFYPISFINVNLYAFDILVKNNTIKMINTPDSVNSIKVENINIFTSINIQLIENIELSGFYLEQISEIYIYSFVFYLQNEKTSHFISTIPLYINSAATVISLRIFQFENVYSEKCLICLESSGIMKRTGEITLTDTVFKNILIKSLATASPILILLTNSFQINLIRLQIFNSSLIDESNMEGSSSAISIEATKSRCLFQNISISNSSSNGDVNSIFIFLLELAIRDSFFQYGNSFCVIKCDIYIIAKGSFVNALVESIFIENTVFSDSYAYNGGALYINFYKKITFVDISYSNFTNLFSIQEGGAVYLLKNNDMPIYIRVYNCEFRNIASLKDGGAFYIRTLSIAKFLIEKTKIFRINALSGGVLDAKNINLTISSTEIANNYLVYQKEIADFFTNYFDAEFLHKLNIGSLFNINGIMFKSIDNFFHDLMPSTSDSQPTLLLCMYCNFMDIRSVYEKINFWNYGFYLKGGTGSLIDVKYSWLKSIYYSAICLAKEEYIVEEKNNYFPFFNVFSAYVNISNVIVNNLDCENSTVGGCFLYAINGEVDISFSLFSNNLCLFGLLSIESSFFKLNNTIFDQNKAMKNAGSLYLVLVETVISDCSFLGNIAYGYGGAIYSSINNSQGSISIYGSKFIKNIAKIGGAIYYRESLTFFASNNYFEHNKGLLYGQNLYSYPAALCFYNTFSNSCLSKEMDIYEFGSGSQLSSIFIKIFDEEFNQIIKNEDSMDNLTLTISLISNNSQSSLDQKTMINSSLSLSNIMLSDSNLFQIENLKVIGYPTSELIISFSSPNIKKKNLTFTDEIFYSLQLHVHLRACIVGEFFQESTGICYVCPQNTFSYDPSVEGCNKCLKGLDCQGGSTVVVVPNFWRKNIYSSSIFYCLQLPEACMGGIGYENNLCSYGHIGAKCESCDLSGSYWNTSFSRTNNYECTKCDDIKLNYVFLVLFSIFNFFSMALSIKGTLDNIKTKLKMKIIKVFARYSMLIAEKNESSIYLKIYFSYFQVIQVLTLLNMDVPSWFNPVGKTIGSPITSVLYSTDCLIAQFHSSIPIIHAKLILALITPFVYLFIFMFGYVLFIKKSKFHRKYAMLYTVCLFTLLYFQPNIVESIILVLSCVTVGDEQYIKGDMAFKCNDYEYFYSVVIGIPALFLWAVGAPLMILWRIFLQRKRLDSIAIYIKYGYIYEEYNIFYWEFIRIYEKILITVIVSFYDSNILIKGILVLIILFLYRILLEKKNPYKTKALNKSDKLSHFVCLISIMMGLLIFDNNYNYIGVISYIVILILNVTFNIFILKNVFSMITFKINHYYIVLKKNTFKLFPFLNKYFKKEMTLKSKEKWMMVRRLVGKYLRKREVKRMELFQKIKLENVKNVLSSFDEEIVNLNRRSSPNFSQEKEDIETEHMEETSKYNETSRNIRIFNHLNNSLKNIDK